MNQEEFVNELWNDERIRNLGFSKREINTFINVLKDKIIDVLIQGKKLKIRGLFTLSTRKNKGHKVTNPYTMEPIFINDYYRVIVKPSKKMKDELRKKALDN